MIKRSSDAAEATQPGEKIEFSSLMHEIKVLPLNYPDYYEVGLVHTFTACLLYGPSWSSSHKYIYGYALFSSCVNAKYAAA